VVRLGPKARKTDRHAATNGLSRAEEAFAREENHRFVSARLKMGDMRAMQIDRSAGGRRVDHELIQSAGNLLQSGHAARANHVAHRGTPVHLRRSGHYSVARRQPTAMNMRKTTRRKVTPKTDAHGHPRP